ncbi:MAG: hypothetical protein VKJ06_01950 [Vampirovibrionales bacterium]|nr:hypothetical protein [Vampirovibrionales bacterium]
MAQNTAAPSVKPLEIEAQARDAEKNPRQIRQAGEIPATIYGGTEAPVSIQVVKDEIDLPLKRGQRNFVLKLAGKPVAVKAQQMQRAGASDELLTIEFMRA